MELMMTAKIRQVSIYDLEVSGYNDHIYHRINSDDADIEDLAASIKKNGVLEPLVISEDGFIISGHRRRMACIKLGIKTVPCITEPVNVDDPKYLKLLREYNRQRVKSIDEVIREQVLDVSGEDIDSFYKARIEKTRVSIPEISITGEKKRAGISKNKQPFLNSIIEIINSLYDFWPLSDRKIHYELLNDPPLKHAKKPDSIYQNDRKSYQSLCELLTRARLVEIIPWDAIDDPTRPRTNWDVYPNIQLFIKSQMQGFMNGYFRDYMQSQPNYIVIVAEKNTLEGTIRPIAMEYTIPYIIGRGYCSIQPRHEIAEKFIKSGKKRLVVLILSDFDPDGEMIANSFSVSMRDDFGIEAIYPVKVALKKEQIDAFHLPESINKAKQGSSNYKNFVKKYGPDVYELEALKPKALQELLDDAIKSVIDIDLFNAEIEQEQKDITVIKEYRDKILKAIN
jgi:hypothetical protein